MAGVTFAAIDIGSYNVSMEIFEIQRNHIKTLNSIRSRLELGSDTFNLKKISLEKLSSLLNILKDYKNMMAEYQVTSYRACAKSALREAGNRSMVLAAVFQATGIRIDILSNSEQRFLGYKAIASRGDEFKKFIEKGTAIIDLGGGSVQISLFDRQALLSTQNIKLGSVRMRENLAIMERFSHNYEELVEEYMEKDLESFKTMYLQDHKIENVILVGDFFTNLVFENKTDTNKIETREEFRKWYDRIIRKSPYDLSREFSIGIEMAAMIIPSAILYKRILEELGTATIWLPGIQLTDGIAYDYADRHRLIRTGHDFEKDILMAAFQIAARYDGNRKHTEHLLKMAEKIFNAVKREHGLDERDWLLLEVACILHDCGRYVSMRRSADCAYEIVMATEIIGLSDTERAMIANIVKYHNLDFDYEEIGTDRKIPEEKILIIAKLTAILRLANTLDQSYRQKTENVEASLKNNHLILTVDCKEDFTLERGFFERKKAFFQEVYCLEVTFKQKGRKGK